MPIKLIAAFLVASAAWAGIIEDVREAIANKNFALGNSLIAGYRAKQGVTPEMLEALSWLGRGALAAKQFDKADAYATETQRLTVQQLKHRKLDSDPHLAIALGAAIEVQALVAVEKGDRSQAVSFLEDQLAAYRATSIRTRIQKIINLLSLAGKAAPPLEEREYLGRSPRRSRHSEANLCSCSSGRTGAATASRKRRFSRKLNRNTRRAGCCWSRPRNGTVMWPAARKRAPSRR